MNAIPIYDRVLIRPEEESKEDKGIYVPDYQKTSTGLIVSSGPKCQEVKAGDKVKYRKNTGLEICVDGEDLIIMPEREILVKI